MRFYSIGWKEFYALPIYTFWELSKNIERIRAEEDLRMMSVIGCCFSSESGYAKELVDTRGDVIEIEENVSEALARLKALMGGG